MVLIESPHSHEIRQPAIRLRSVEEGDLYVLYKFQLEPKANALALSYPRSEEAFFARSRDIMANPDIVSRVILVDDELAGTINCFPAEVRTFVGYWVGQKFWGQGVATRALELLLEEVTERPLYARVATSNIPSLRVLQKCGFEVIGHQHAPECERFQACEEAVLMLTAEPQADQMD